jgi:dihydrofolate reductase
MTRRIIATDYISLDGVIQDPVGMENSGLGDWTGPFGRGPEGDRLKHDELLAASALIMGRLTYDGFAAVWPNVHDPKGFADRINLLPKHVASRTLRDPQWRNTSIIEGDPVQAVRDLKESAGDGDILIYGSASIVHQIIPHGLVDEFRLMIYPVVLGRGVRLFPQAPALRLTLTDQRRLGDGIVHLTYVPAAHP